jgi:hypothetical protein
MKVKDKVIEDVLYLIINHKKRKGIFFSATACALKAEIHFAFGLSSYLSLLNLL